MTFVALDEWLRIPPRNEGSCSFYLNHHLFEPLNVLPEQIHLFDALSTDPDSERARIDAVIRRKGKIDLMVVGVGINGHIGFNEPGVPANLYSHGVDLDPITKWWDNNILQTLPGYLMLSPSVSGIFLKVIK
jgi:6-phosphogluconolactonase/glucosamine-6-phosphate isomerase/deaminase